MPSAIESYQCRIGRVSSRGPAAAGERASVVVTSFLTDADTPIIADLTKFLIAANQDSGNLVVFAIDHSNGKLTPTGQTLEIPSPACVKFLPALN